MTTEKTHLMLLSCLHGDIKSRLVLACYIWVGWNKIAKQSNWIKMDINTYACWDGCSGLCVSELDNNEVEFTECFKVQRVLKDCSSGVVFINLKLFKVLHSYVPASYHSTQCHLIYIQAGLEPKRHHRSPSLFLLSNKATRNHKEKKNKVQNQVYQDSDLWLPDYDNKHSILSWL